MLLKTRISPPFSLLLIFGYWNNIFFFHKKVRAKHLNDTGNLIKQLITRFNKTNPELKHTYVISFLVHVR